MRLNRAWILIIITALSSARSSSAITESMFGSDPISINDAIGYLEQAQKESRGDHLLYAKATLEILRARDLHSLSGPAERTDLLTRARKDLASAAKLGGETADYHYLMAILAIETDVDLPTATSHLEKSIKAGPETDKVIEQLAILYEAQKRYQDAVRLLSERVKSSENPQLHHLLAVAYLYLEDHPHAEQSAGKAVALGGGKEAQLVLASAQSLSGHLTDAEATLRAVLAGDPGNRTALVGLADVLRKQGQTKAAQEVASELGRRYPDDKEIQTYLKGIAQSDSKSPAPH